MLERMDYQKASDERRAADDAQTVVDFSVALQKAGRDFRDLATRAIQASETADAELKAVRADAGAATHGYEEPIKARAATEARLKAEMLIARANAAGKGRLRFSQQEMGDVEFMREHAALVHVATAFGLVES